MLADEFFGAPGLNWDSMLKMTKVNLELISDIDVHLFIEKGMRGGISYIGKRHSKSEKSKFIMYLDANILHGWTMSQYYHVVSLND